MVGKSKLPTVFCIFSLLQNLFCYLGNNMLLHSVIGRTYLFGRSSENDSTSMSTGSWREVNGKLLDALIANEHDSSLAN